MKFPNKTGKFSTNWCLRVKDREMKIFVHGLCLLGFLFKTTSQHIVLSGDGLGVTTTLTTQQFAEYLIKYRIELKNLHDAADNLTLSDPDSGS